MPIIQKLDDLTISQIAAGEIIERPASVIRELCDNAVDAGATAVSITIEQGGLLSITVTDNGCGMGPQDAAMAFERHATSKLRHARQLATVETMGFRGEALAAVASIAQVTMHTRLTSAKDGVCVEVEGGGAPKITPAGCAPGTRITVKNLFYNAPARRAFQKTPGAETAACTETVIRAALAHPCVSFSMNGENGELVRTEGGGLQSAICATLKLQPDDLVPVKNQNPGITIEGFLAKPELARGNRTRQFVVVGGRCVNSRTLALAVERAYEGLLPHGRYPMFCVSLALPPGDVDCNVHPAKAEVRLHYEREVASFVGAAARAAVAGLANVPSVTAPVLPAFTAYVPAPEPEPRPRPIYYEKPVGRETRLSMPSLLEISQQSPRQNYQFIGQLWQTYLLWQCEETLYIMDQHAAHERFLFDRYSAQLLSGNVATQTLLEPLPLELTGEEAAALEESAPLLNGMGFIIEGQTLHGVPAWLLPCDLAALGADITQTLQDAAGPLRERVMRMACRRAVKAGHTMRREDAEMLLRLALDKGGLTCPHGRPVFIEMPRTEFETRFKRF